MVVRHGHVVAEGWWAPYSADRPHLLYSLTKSFTSIAVGLAVADGLLSLDDRVVDVLPDHVPADVSEQARRLTVHHLLSMTTGHRTDSLAEAWELEPDDLVKGFLRVPLPDAEGTRHAYDNATTFVLARMVERVTGRGLPELLDERLFRPMGVDHAEWDRVASGAAFGFHGLHLTTEAVAAFGELLLRGGLWGDRQLVPREWVGLATSTARRQRGRSRTTVGRRRLQLRVRLPVLEVAARLPRSRRLRPAVRGRPVARSRGRRDRPGRGAGRARRALGVPAARHGRRGKRPGRRGPRRAAAAAVAAAGAGSAAPERSVKARSTPPPRIRRCPTGPR